MSTDGYGLGRLERLGGVREVWPDEAVDFTPWLAENIDVLSDAIGLPLTVVAQEVAVGEFRLDIHAVDADGQAVVIENQLGPSDHSHLGQLLVYASGLEAATAVWITTRLREDHRSALTWLNERTDAGVRAFGVELSLARIGDSVPAPVLDVVVEPNEWARATKKTANAATSDLQQARMAFYDDVFGLVTTRYPAIQPPKTQPGNWISFASGPFGYYCLTFSRAGYRVEVFLDTQERRTTKALYDGLRARREEIEAAVGFALEWDRTDENRSSRIWASLPGFDLLQADEATRDEAVEWSAERAIGLHRHLDGTLREQAALLKRGVGLAE
ncbi:DUF4268 domain-containing protein [Actinokineospora bangkokensis]|uniref:DUF4268 domain-containing protein n=1 Tax=Actinokineospora bangkokensis TaxID=1193682 RepID=UPI000A043323|nr:DUF4268 domain-containing protein [Actinokineospora bangkokensis]